MAERVASPVFVGRRTELAALGAALTSPTRTAAVLVGGEAGAGKSRLVAEFAAAAAGSGARVLTGACVALGAESLPYAPFMGVLGQLAAEIGPAGIEALVGPGRVDLARLVPELRRPGDDSRPSGPAERAVLFQVVLRTIEALGAQTPLVVVIEDLHWADGSSRELLAFLLGRMGTGVLLVATYRSDEVHRRHPLRPFLAEAARSERVTRIDLAPLSPAEVTQQLEAIAGSALPAAVVAAVVRRAEGNPFFAEELLAAGGGDELPPDLAEVLTARLSALPAAAQDLVAVAAVAGRRVGHDLLAAAVAGSEADVGAGLREAISHNVLVADTAGAYAFRHALLAEAAYAELLPAERTPLHRAYAAALAAHPEWATTPGGAAGELAHHWLAAREPARALEASVAAADAATTAYAFAEAHALYEQAVRLWDEVADARGSAGCERAQLLQRAADAAKLAGATARAVSLLQAALDSLGPAVEGAPAAMLHERLARLFAESGQTEASLAAGAAAAALMPAEPSAARAQVIGGEARNLMVAGRYRQACARAETAVEVARAAGARREEGYALNTFGASLARLGDMQRAIPLLEEALAIARAVGSLEDLRRAYNNLATAVQDVLGEPGRAAAVALEGAAHLGALGYEEGANLLRSMAAESLLTGGRWADAAELACTVLASGEGDDYTWQAQLVAGTASLRRGEFRTAHGYIEKAQRRWAESGHVEYRAMLGIASAELALAEGRRGDARDIVGDTLAILDATEVQDFVLRLVSLGLRAQDEGRRGPGTIGMRDSQGRHPEEALIASARATRPVVADGHGAQTTVQGKALHALCEAEWARLQGDHDGGAWARVGEAWGGSYPYELAYATWRQAEAYLASGARDEAANSLREAWSMASQLGAAPLVGDIEALAHRARIRLAPAASRQRSAPGDATELTRREAEVLRLLAAGHTNHQIAETLYMSDKTASVHVSRILTKLGVTNRGQAAALAHRLGLIEEPSAR